MARQTVISPLTQAIDQMQASPEFNQLSPVDQLEQMSTWEQRLTDHMNQTYQGGYDQFTRDNPLSVDYLEDRKKFQFSRAQNAIDTKHRNDTLQGAGDFFPWAAKTLTMGGETNARVGAATHFAAGTRHALATFNRAFGNEEAALKLDREGRNIRENFQDALDGLFAAGTQLESKTAIGNEVAAFVGGFFGVGRDDIESQEILKTLSEQDIRKKGIGGVLESTALTEMMGEFAFLRLTMSAIPGGAATGKLAKTRYALRYATAAVMSDVLGVKPEELSFGREAGIFASTGLALLGGMKLSEYAMKHPLIMKTLGKMPKWMQGFFGERIADVGESIADSVYIGATTGDVGAVIRAFPASLAVNMVQELLIDIPGSVRGFGKGRFTTNATAELAKAERTVTARIEALKSSDPAQAKELGKALRLIQATKNDEIKILDQDIATHRAEIDDIFKDPQSVVKYNELVQTFLNQGFTEKESTAIALQEVSANSIAANQEYEQVPEAQKIVDQTKDMVNQMVETEPFVEQEVNIEAQTATGLGETELVAEEIGSPQERIDAKIETQRARTELRPGETKFVMMRDLGVPTAGDLAEIGITPEDVRRANPSVYKRFRKTIIDTKPGMDDTAEQAIARGDLSVPSSENVGQAATALVASEWGLETATGAQYTPTNKEAAQVRREAAEEEISNLEEAQESPEFIREQLQFELDTDTITIAEFYKQLEEAGLSQAPAQSSEETPEPQTEMGIAAVMSTQRISPAVAEYRVTELSAMPTEEELPFMTDVGATWGEVTDDFDGTQDRFNNEGFAIDDKYHAEAKEIFGKLKPDALFPMYWYIQMKGDEVKTGLTPAEQLDIAVNGGTFQYGDETLVIKEASEAGKAELAKWKPFIVASSELSQDKLDFANRLIQENADFGKYLEDIDVLKQSNEFYLARILKPARKSKAQTEAAISESTGRLKSRKYPSLLWSIAQGNEIAVADPITATAIARKQVGSAIAMRNYKLAAEKAGMFTTNPPDSENWRLLKNRVWDVRKPIIDAQGQLVTDSNDKAVYESKPLYAPIDIAKGLNNITKQSDLSGTKFDVLLNAQSVIKRNIFTLSLFHYNAFLRQIMLGSVSMNPRKTLNLGRDSIRNMTQEFIDLSEGGLTLGSILQDFDTIRKLDETRVEGIFKKQGLAGTALDKMRGLRKWYEDTLFNKFGPYAKMGAAILEYRNSLKKETKALDAGTLTRQQIAKDVATRVNDDFGGLNLRRLRRNPSIQKMWRALLLAPDWTESNIRAFTGMFKKGHGGRVYRRMWMRIGMRFLVMQQILNFLMAAADDESFVDRYQKAWKEGKLRWLGVDITPIYKALGGDDDKRKYFNLLGHFRDPIKWAFNPIRSVRHKGNFLTAAAIEAFTGRDWAGRPFSSLETLVTEGKTVTHPFQTADSINWDTATSFLVNKSKGAAPIPVQAMLGFAMGELDEFDAASRALGLRVETTFPRKPKRRKPKIK